MKKTILALVLCSAIALTACVAAALADTIISIAAPALNNILTVIAISENKPVNATLEAKITADATGLENVVNSFGTSAGTTCQQIEADLSTFQNDIGTVEQIVQISNPGTQAKVADIVALVVSTFDAFAVHFGSCSATAAAASARVSQLKVAPATTVPEFVSRYNALMKPLGGTT